jgi:rhodanese-related sulfurtransferase
VLGEWQYRVAHIPGSVNLPCSRDLFRSEDVLEGLDRDDEIVVYCSNATCWASIAAYYFLVSRGYRNVRRYEGGLADWESAGYPLDGEMVAAPEKQAGIVTRPISTPPVTSRPGPSGDSVTSSFPVAKGLADLSQGLGSNAPANAPEHSALARISQEGRSWYEHLARTARKFWRAGRALVVTVMIGVPSVRSGRNPRQTDVGCVGQEYVD